ncbi:PAS fold-containing protein [Collimonas sp. OK307]|uniref:ATP-binding protein n=1 Tax=Collimonas sp. OK307 TaxID=1801620 RepID=UPI0008ED8B2E|nr:ATP-binding protein [Collimonas sp. OK307]SFH62025.1 PAS fold-containing protein [Collimonas sp. OK307]
MPLALWGLTLGAFASHAQNPEVRHVSEREFDLRKRLGPNWALIPPSLETCDQAPALIFPDPGGVPLCSLPKGRLDAGDFLSVALALTAAVKDMHSSGLLHLDLHPSSIVLANNRRIYLTGFGKAKYLTEYLTETQTGYESTTKICRAHAMPDRHAVFRGLDGCRNDLYSLGPTAGRAEPSTQIWESLSLIVMELLGRNNGEYYQSAQSVLTDLVRCRSEWRKSGRANTCAPLRHGSAHELLATQEMLSLENASLSKQLQLESDRRRNAEDALKASQTSLEIARILTQAGIWRWNIETGEFNCCKEFIRILNFDSLPRTITIKEFLERVHSDDRTQVEREIYEVLNEGQSLQQEFRIALPDGTLRHLRSVGRTEINRAGKLEFFGSIIDVSSQKRSDEALRLAQAELARAERITTMGQFAASMGHEISQPLAAIVLNANAALCWLRQGPAHLAQVEAALNLILQAGNSAGSVIRSIRGMACKAGPEIAPFIIDDAIREVLLLLRAELQNRKIKVRTQFTLGTRLLSADRVQLQQVMMNLLLNAIDAMSNVESRTRVLDVRTAIVDTSGTVRLSVEDNGIGIDANSAERLFDPLFSTKPSGMGIGLTICRSIVEAHGGRIWCVSRQPTGTSFHVSLRPGSTWVEMPGDRKILNSDKKST